EPVWNTSIGNWSSRSPAATRSPAAAIRSALSASSRPSSAFTRAAAALMRPSQRATGAGIGSPETGKFSTAFCVSPPQSSFRVPVDIPASLASADEPPARASMTLGGGVEPPALRWPLAQHPAQLLRQVGDGRPADVVAALAFAGLHVLALPRRD